jgi:hypothetical protein
MLVAAYSSAELWTRKVTVLVGAVLKMLSSVYDC